MKRSKRTRKHKFRVGERFDDDSIRRAVNLWCSNKREALRIYGPIEDWNVSGVTLTTELFAGKRNFNENIGNWDVSNVEVMDNMFQDASSFNQDLDKWDVSKVESMRRMFDGAVDFNGNISTWNMSRVGTVDYDQGVQYMFREAKSFDRDISTKRVTKDGKEYTAWDVSRIHDMESMFDGAESFNQNIGNWDVSRVYIMSAMFRDAKSFNGNISSWDVSNVGYVNEMFDGATSFDQDLSNWDLSNVYPDEGGIESIERVIGKNR
jgi:surface protein